MKQITFLVLLLINLSGYSQSVLEDFEVTSELRFSTNDNNGSVSIVSDPEVGGTRGNVLKLVTASGQSWTTAELILQGDHIDLTAASTQRTVEVDVYSTTARTFMAKVAGTGDDSAGNSTAAHAGAGWETITFDFTVGQDNTAAADGIYGEIFFFPFRDTANNTWHPADNSEFYFDNIKAIGAPAPTLPSFPFDFETSSIGFGSWGSAGFAQITNPDPSGINTSSNVGEFTHDGTGGYIGIESDGTFDNIDFTATPTFKVKVWVDEPVEVIFKLQNNPTYQENTEKKYQVTQEETSKWIQLEFNFSDVTATNYNRVILYFDGGNSIPSGAGHKYYFDDIEKSSGEVADPTCTDGIQNGDETGVDCGGSSCNACEVLPSFPFDFETSSIGFGSWGSAGFAQITNPDPSGINTSSNVGEFTHDGSGGYIGIESDGTFDNIDFTATPTFKVKVWVDEPVEVIFKLQNNPTYQENSEKKYQVSQEETSKWIQLEFNFSDVTATNYNRVVLYFDGGNSIPSGAGHKYYFDDIEKFTFTPITDANFEAAINNCLATNPIDGMCSNSEYGAMPTWDVSTVTDMSNAFKDKTEFNADLSAWDVSNVTTMYRMFYKATSFNADLSSWDVSTVTTMSNMFYKAASFNGDLSAWNVNNVANMSRMFNYSSLSTENYDNLLIGWSQLTLQQGVEFGAADTNYCNGADARDLIIGNFGWTITDGILTTECELTITDANIQTAINVCLSIDPVNGLCSESKYGGSMPTWDVSRVTDMSYAFKDKTEFNADLSSWDVSNVTTMEWMFYKANSFNTDLSDWDVSNVTNMGNMFREATAFNADLSDWDVSIVTNMSGMFSNANAFNADLSSWDVSNVTTMEWMFSFATAFNSDLSEWDVSTVTTMSSIFRETASFNGNISAWDVSNVTNMYDMFNNASSFNQDIGNWDVGNVTNMQGMFINADTFNQDISSWDVSSVTNMQYMFYSSSLSTENYDKLLVGWSQLTLQQGVQFHAYGTHYCNGAAARQRIIDTYGWTIYDSSENCITAITDANFKTAINTCLTTNPVDGMCSDSEYGAMPDWDVSRVTNMGGGFWKKAQFNGNISAWDVSSVTDMTGMFSNATAFNADLSAWDVSSVADMTRMFSNATAFNADLSAWDVSSVADMTWMFSNATAFNADLSDWEVSNVTDMTGVFLNASSFNGNLSSWDVSNVIDMGWMFKRASLFNGDLSSWDVRKVTNMNSMFASATAFNQDISDWDVSNVTNMGSMFSFAGEFNVDISDWNVSNVKDMNSMFYDVIEGINSPSIIKYSLTYDDYTLVGNGKYANFDIRPGEDEENFEVIRAKIETILLNNFTNPVIGDLYAVTYNYYYGGVGSDVVLLRFDGTEYHIFDRSSKIINYSLTYDDYKLVGNGNYGNFDIRPGKGEENFEVIRTKIETILLNNFTNPVIGDLYAVTYNYYYGGVGSDVVLLRFDGTEYRIFNRSSFDQNIGSWDMRSVTDMTNMLSNSNISIENYDAILNGWSSKTNKQGVRLGANGLNYCNAQYARQSIIDTYGWTIIDAGEYCSTLSTEVLEKTSFTISPNPTSDFLSITGNQKRVSISIYNLLGKEVLPESNSNKVNVKALPNGIYVIRIREGLQEVRKKFVKN